MKIFRRAANAPFLVRKQAHYSTLPCSLNETFTFAPPFRCTLHVTAPPHTRTQNRKYRSKSQTEVSRPEIMYILKKDIAL
jgi:hypothetical protein